jgi:hypothetical protein
VSGKRLPSRQPLYPQAEAAFVSPALFALMKFNKVVICVCLLALLFAGKGVWCMQL